LLSVSCVVIEEPLHERAKGEPSVEGTVGVDGLHVVYPTDVGYEEGEWLWVSIVLCELDSELLVDEVEISSTL
jgi:hypothetical protein